MKPALIPRRIFFDNPDVTMPKLSFNGQYLTYLAPHNGIQNIWIRTLGSHDDHPVTNEKKRGIQEYKWAPDNTHILFLQDNEGDENWRIYTVNIETEEYKLHTPAENVQAEILKIDHEFPNEILIALNERDPQVKDVYRLCLDSGTKKLAVRNDFGASWWHADHLMQVRIMILPQADGGLVIMHRHTSEHPWENIFQVGIEDAPNTGVIEFAQDNRHILMVSSMGFNATTLMSLDTQTGASEVEYSDPVFEVSEVLIHPVRHSLQAVGVMRERMDWEVMDPRLQPHFDIISKLDRGDVGIVDTDIKDETWLIRFTPDNGPHSYYVYDMKSRQAKFLFHNRKALKGLPLSTMQPVSLKSRDGLTLHGYLSRPVNAASEQLPCVIMVHGGPWDRDVWGYHPEVQWLTNRGYIVLQVNYRGSTGYGREFRVAADKEWGAKMQDDITDSVYWLIAQGIADPRRIGIYGASFGGYAALVGLSKTPDLYACGIDVVGPSNLITFLENLPPYWEILRPMMEERIGHPVHEREMLMERSPLFHSEQITSPLLICHGANDPRVPREESIQMRDALLGRGVKVEYIEFTDEGHGMESPENRLVFYGKIEAFLAKYLGGGCE